MDKKEVQKKIADIMYHALKGDITEKEMHEQTFEVLKELDTSRINLKINPERFDKD